MSEIREIYCCQCEVKINARLTDGQEIYPHRPDLQDLPFWKCDDCKGFVGCHHKTRDRTNPLGNIPTPELKDARKHIHAFLDPMWINKPNKRKARKNVYDYLSENLGFNYHTADLKTIEEARTTYRLLIKYKEEKFIDN